MPDALARIAYILLCHKDPDAIIRQARQLTAQGDYMVIHFDARGDAAGNRKLHAALSDNPNVAFAAKRIRCGWGEWSLVRATIAALKTALRRFDRATHFYLLSGDCMPIKTAEHIHDSLDTEDADFIECFDFFDSDWIKTGRKQERLIYRHYVNERKHKKLFDTCVAVQRRLGLKRAPPEDLDIRVGSQWWCLRRKTVERVLTFARRRRDVQRFFKTTWIPDETFFQTAVAHLVPADEIRNQTPTFLIFTDYGMPVEFHNDHYDFLRRQQGFFARKISPESSDLKNRLYALHAATAVAQRVAGDGPRLYTYLAAQGRRGCRFAPRIWQRAATIGADYHLHVILSKNRKTAAILRDRIERATAIPTVGYLFDDEVTELPDLGGIQTTLEKLCRHRRSVLRLLFDATRGKRLVICLDPGNLDILLDLRADQCALHLLDVREVPSDNALMELAYQQGLVTTQTAKTCLDQLLPAIRTQLAFETAALRDAGFEDLCRIDGQAPPDENTRALCAFLAIPHVIASDIVKDDTLFSEGRGAHGLYIRRPEHLCQNPARRDPEYNRVGDDA